MRWLSWRSISTGPGTMLRTELWEELDKELWASTQNPWVILRTVSHEKIKAALGAVEFRSRLDSLLQQNRESYQADAWFQHKHPGAALSRQSPTSAWSSC